MKYAQAYAPDANQIKLKKQELTVKGISQMYMDCPSESDKYEILCQLYGLLTVGSSIIFVKVRYTTRVDHDRNWMLTSPRHVKAPTRFRSVCRMMATEFRCFTEPTRAVRETSC